MIEWIIGLFVAKHILDKEDKKKCQDPTRGEYNLYLPPFTYLKGGETAEDLV